MGRNSGIGDAHAQAGDGRSYGRRSGGDRRDPLASSLHDAGLLEEAIGPAFREDTGIILRFIPKGIGAAI